MVGRTGCRGNCPDGGARERAAELPHERIAFAAYGKPSRKRFAHDALLRQRNQLLAGGAERVVFEVRAYGYGLAARRVGHHVGLPLHHLAAALKPYFDVRGSRVGECDYRRYG